VLSYEEGQTRRELELTKTELLVSSVEDPFFARSFDQKFKYAHGFLFSNAARLANARTTINHRAIPLTFWPMR
jgi:hypothetical protein